MFGDRFVFAHRFTRYLEHDAMTLMNETVQDRVCQGRIAEIGMPGIDGLLAGDQRGASVDAVIEDFEQIRAILGGQRRQAPVIEDRLVSL